MKRKIIGITAIGAALVLSCWPVKADDTTIKVFPFDGEAGDEPVTYPATDLSRPDVSDSEVNMDKDVPGIQIREFDDTYELIVHKKGSTQNLGDTIQYQGKPITLDLDGVRHINKYYDLDVRDGDAKESGSGAVFDVQGPSVEKKLVTAAHDAVVKEYLGDQGLHEAEGEFDTNDYSSYETDMFTDHLAVRLNHYYGNDIAIDIPFEITSYSLEELRKYKSASEFVQATGYMQNDEKYTHLIGTVGELYNTVLYANHNGNIQEMMEAEVKQDHASGWGFRKRIVPCITLKLPKNAPHLKQFYQYWLDRQSKWGGVYDPIDRGDCYEFKLYEFQGTIKNWFDQIDYAEGALQDVKKVVPLDETDHYECKYKELSVKEYFTYFPFSNRQAVNAWAAEMDSWDGHWDRFLNGTIYDQEKGKFIGGTLGYYQGNWGNTWTGIQCGQHTDHIPDVYEYTITGPGIYTITMTGTNHYHGTIVKKLAVLTDAFCDVDSNTPHTADITWMYVNQISEGWLEGDHTRTYRPMNEVVRQDMAAFLRREAVKLGVSDASTWKPSAADWKTFKDVNKNTPHAEDILWLAHAGISTGWTEKDGSRTYRGMDTVKRQDMAAFLHRLANLAGIDKTTDTMSFKDVNKRTPHAQDINWLGGTGISTGYWDGTYRGMTPVYRQDMAAFIHRLDDLK